MKKLNCQTEFTRSIYSIVRAHWSIIASIFISRNYGKSELLTGIYREYLRCIWRTSRMISNAHRKRRRLGETTCAEEKWSTRRPGRVLVHSFWVLLTARHNWAKRDRCLSDHFPLISANRRAQVFFGTCCSCHWRLGDREKALVILCGDASAYSRSRA